MTKNRTPFPCACNVVMLDGNHRLCGIRSPFYVDTKYGSRLNYCAKHISRAFDHDHVLASPVAAGMNTHFAVSIFPHPAFVVSSFEAASREYCRQRDASGEDASTWPDGKFGDGDPFRISYNGRVWIKVGVGEKAREHVVCEPQ